MDCKRFPLRIETDVTFRVQRNDSGHASSIKYFRLDTQRVDEFSFNGGLLEYTQVYFTGKTIICLGGVCNSLPKGQHVPVVLFSLDFNPQAGYVKNWNWERNKYSFRGSFYSVVCSGN